MKTDGCQLCKELINYTKDINAVCSKCSMKVINEDYTDDIAIITKFANEFNNDIQGIWFMDNTAFGGTSILFPFDKFSKFTSFIDTKIKNKLYDVDNPKEFDIFISLEPFMHHDNNTTNHNGLKIGIIFNNRRTLRDTFDVSDAEISKFAREITSKNGRKVFALWSITDKCVGIQGIIGNLVAEYYKMKKVTIMLSSE